MNIFYDARWTRYPTHLGVSRYGTELAIALSKLHKITLIISDERQLTMFPKGMDYVLLNNPISVRELFLAPKLNKLDADVVFSPLQVMGNWGRKYKLILTMQDVIYYHYPAPPKDLPFLARALWWLSYQAYWPQRFLLNMADRVVTVSHTSKDDIINFHLTDRPVDVVTNAPNKPANINRTKKIKKDLVYVSSFMKYKNHETLVRMVNLLPGYTLHFTSPVRPERQAELTQLAKNPRQLKFWNGASDEQMYRLLASATAAVHSSKAEGFGLPVIEAMSVGTPVVCSDMPIFHEIGGQAVQYCDPDSPEQYVAAIRRLEDPKIARKYTRVGLKQAQKFTWDRSAKALLATIKRLTG